MPCVESLFAADMELGEVGRLVEASPGDLNREIITTLRLPQKNQHRNFTVTM